MSATRTSSSSCANNVVVKSRAPNWPKMVSYKATTAPELISNVASSSTVAATAVSAASLRRPSPNPKGTGTATGGMGRSSHISVANLSNKDKGSNSNGSNNSNSNRKPLLTGGDYSTNNNNIKGVVVKPNSGVSSKGLLPVAMDYRSGENQNSSNTQAPYLNNNTTYLSPRNRRLPRSEEEDACTSAAASTGAVAFVQPPLMSSNNNNIKVLALTHRSTDNVTVGGIGASCGNAHTQLVRQCHKCQVLFAHSHICG